MDENVTSSGSGAEDEPKVERCSTEWEKKDLWTSYMEKLAQLDTQEEFRRQHMSRWVCDCHERLCEDCPTRVEPFNSRKASDT